MSRDPLKHEINEIEETKNVIEGDMVGTVGASDKWTTWRNDLAFQILSNIFGKDLANGQRAEVPADMMEEQSNNEVNASDNSVQECISYVFK
ncbi:unnamed protein product [Prunus brigantina]